MVVEANLYHQIYNYHYIFGLPLSRTLDKRKDAAKQPTHRIAKIYLRYNKVESIYLHGASPDDHPIQSESSPVYWLHLAMVTVACGGIIHLPLGTCWYSRKNVDLAGLHPPLSQRHFHYCLRISQQSLSKRRKLRVYIRDNDLDLNSLNSTFQEPGLGCEHHDDFCWRYFDAESALVETWPGFQRWTL